MALSVVGRPTHTPAGKPIVYLTFDDGPAADTPGVLAALARHGAQATFFIVGRRVQELPQTVQAMLQAGHTVGNHSFTHPRLGGMPEAEFLIEMQQTAAAVAEAAQELLPDGKMKLMRPPYGSHDENTEPWVNALGYAMVMWDVDPEDWSEPGTEAIASQVLAGVKPGAIVLLHDGGGDRSQTVAAVEQLLPALAEQGYVFHSLKTDS
ncbi:MAG: polysaccharide deacetylase family protein [Anaerolineales bacterium]|nr:MAG: polysaccharide deacetylase family protein [Anaerolineales bacterium]